MPGPIGRHARLIWQTMAFIVVLLPWIWPIAEGPSVSFIPWLASATCAVLLLGIVLLSRQECSMAMLSAWLMAAVISSAIGLVQYSGASVHFKPWINVTRIGEAFGNLRQRNQFATLVNIGLVVLLFGMPAPGAWRSLFGQAARRAAARSTQIAVLLVVLLAFANAASLSRTGLVQLVLLMLLALLWRRSLPSPAWIIPATAISAYVIGSLLLPMSLGQNPFTDGIGSRFSDPELACSRRLLLWKNVLHLIMQKPWWGWGWGELDYAHFITLYPDGHFCAILDNAHNLPLHLAAVFGIPVASAMTAMLVGAVWRARPWMETVPVRQVAWAVLALIGLHSLLEYPLWYGPFQIAVAMALWILWRRPAQPEGVVVSVAASQGPVSTLVAVSVGAAALTVLSAITYAAWDYHRVSQIYRAPEHRASAYRDDTLAKVQGSWLFRDQVGFAALTLTSVTPENAAAVNHSAHALLHFSPEARVVEKLIDSALLLGKTEEAVFFMRRMRIAYPQDYAQWRETRDPLTDLPVIDP